MGREKIHGGGGGDAKEGGNDTGALGDKAVLERAEDGSFRVNEERLKKFEEDLEQLFSKPMTRRNFVKKVLDGAVYAISAASAGFLTIPPAWQSLLDSDLLEKQMDEDIKALKSHIENRYGIEIRFDLKNLRFKNTKFSMIEIKSKYLEYKALEVLKEQLGVYPPDLVDKYLNGMRIFGSIADMEELRERLAGRHVIHDVGGFAVRRTRTFYIEIKQFLQSYVAMYSSILDKDFIPHEFSHLVMEGVKEKDWNKLNINDECRENGVSADDCNKNYEYNIMGLWKLLDIRREHKPLPGFTRNYGTANFREDMATIAELLFGPKELLEKRLKKDENDQYRVLEKKIAFVKDWYKKETGGLMDKKFWDDFANGEVNEEYWDKRLSNKDDSVG